NNQIRFLSGDRTIKVSVILRIAAIAALALSTIVAQTPDGGSAIPANPGAEVAADAAAQVSLLRPDEHDPMVVRARQNLEQIKTLVSIGALPLMRLNKAQEDVQDSLDMSLLKQSLYSKDLLPEQADQMIQVAQKMVLRRQRAVLEMQQLMDAGIVSRAEAQATSADVDRANRDLEWAKERANLITQLAENV